MKASPFIAGIILLSLLNCGGSGGGGNSSRSESREESVEASPGSFYTVLRPVNFQSNGYIPYGAATLVLKNDQLSIEVVMDDGQPVVHRQALYSGSRCPTMDDDTNGDRTVDYDEALSVVGSVQIALDDNLLSQDSRFEIFPQGSSYTYNKQASFTKLPTVSLERRVVMVQGTTGDSNLSLPVICGVLEKF